MEQIIRSFTLSIVCLAFAFYQATAQPSKKLIEVQVAPTESDWTYQRGDKVDFEVRILKNGQPPNMLILFP
jgi:hypothetical protein